MSPTKSLTLMIVILLMHSLILASLKLVHTLVNSGTSFSLPFSFLSIEPASHLSSESTAEFYYCGIKFYGCQEMKNSSSDKFSNFWLQNSEGCLKDVLKMPFGQQGNRLMLCSFLSIILIVMILSPKLLMLVSFNSLSVRVVSRQGY